jgi:acyl-coenzyme A synthetase/AMP-(fatty) acid ligase
MLMHRLLIEGAERAPDKLALHWVDREVALTYAQAVAGMERMAGALASLGLGKGDRVTIFAHNGMDYLLAMFGAWRLGAIAALVNVQFAAELDYYFADHTPSLVIYTHDKADAVFRAAKSVGTVRHLICMDGPQEGALSLPDLMRAQLPVPADPGDETAIAHTHPEPPAGRRAHAWHTSRRRVRRNALPNVCASTAATIHSARRHCRVPISWSAICCPP